MSRVIALGQPAAGDDGVGPAVLAALREAGAPEGAELLSCADPSGLIELLQAEGPIVLVDAALGERPGEVLTLSAGALALQAPASFSSHGLGVGQAIAIARELAPGAVPEQLHLVAVTIARPCMPGPGLSAEVAAALPAAAERVRALLAG